MGVALAECRQFGAELGRGLLGLFHTDISASYGLSYVSDIVAALSGKSNEQR
jgi:hypothetical protein